jgi:lipopolysaccharide biosynthesis regulator YciM
VTEAIASLSTDPAAARATYLRHLESEASLVMAARWLAGEPLGSTQQQALVLRALDQATQPLKRYRCAACGFEAKQYFWQCPGCQNWDSYPTRRVEEL